MTGPIRTCIVCRTRREQASLFRVRLYQEVLSSLVDSGGRSAYICREKSCVDRLPDRHRLERALRSPILAETKLKLQEELLGLIAE